MQRYQQSLTSTLQCNIFCRLLVWQRHTTIHKKFKWTEIARMQLSVINVLYTEQPFQGFSIILVIISIVVFFYCICKAIAKTCTQIRSTLISQCALAIASNNFQQLVRNRYLQRKKKRCSRQIYYILLLIIFIEYNDSFHNACKILFRASILISSKLTSTVMSGPSWLCNLFHSQCNGLFSDDIKVFHWITWLQSQNMQIC